MIQYRSVTKKNVTICFETLLTTALLFLNPYWGLLLLLFLFLLVDKIDLLKFFIRINFHKINYYLPILIEYSIILLVNLYLAKRMGIKLSIDLKPDSLLSFLSQRIASIIREELVTSFSWFIISFQVISLHQKSMISQNQIGSITLVLAFLFGLGHLSFFYTHPETFSTHDFPVILAVSIVYNAFCIGYYLKTLFIKTFSLPLVVVAHILINLPRYFNHLYKLEGSGLDFNFTYTFLLIPSIYLLYTVLFLQKQGEHPFLESVLAGLLTERGP